MPSGLSIRLTDIAAHIGARVVGDGSITVSGLGSLQTAQPNQIAFLANPVYRKYLATTRAAAVILREDALADCPAAALVVEHPYQAYARITSLFEPLAVAVPGVHATAIVHASAVIGEGVSIGAHAVLEAGVTVGAHAAIGAGCFVGQDSCIGARTRLHANVTVYHGVSIGADCAVHASTVIGSDGFGYAPSPAGWIKIHQIGGVVIGDRVEIGACTAIDRGALQNTTLANGVKIDNQVHIAHNVSIGENSAIAACTGIAGSTVIGANCTLAGGVGVVGHITLTDNVHITGAGMVTHSIAEPGSYSSGTSQMPTAEWRKSVVRFRQLDEMYRRLRKLESRSV